MLSLSPDPHVVPFFSAIFLLIVIYILVGDKVSYFSFVTKETGVYVVFTFGALVSVYRIAEWYLILRDKKTPE